MKIHQPQITSQEEGAWVIFGLSEEPVYVGKEHCVGFDLDGTLANNDFILPGPPYPIGEPIPEMFETAKAFLTAGIKIKIFTARACEPQNIPLVQDWTERHGLGRLEVTNAKDFQMIRYYDDRAIQVGRTSIPR
jgi:hypothetical protein